MGDRRKAESKASKATSNQSRRFIEASRQLGADQFEEAFNQVLRKIAKAPVPPKKPKPE